MEKMWHLVSPETIESGQFEAALEKRLDITRAIIEQKTLNLIHQAIAYKQSHPPHLATAADLGLDEQQVKHPDYKGKFHRKNGSHMQPQNYKQNKR